MRIIQLQQHLPLRASTMAGPRPVASPPTPRPRTAPNPDRPSRYPPAAGSAAAVPPAMHVPGAAAASMRESARYSMSATTRPLSRTRVRCTWKRRRPAPAATTTHPACAEILDHRLGTKRDRCRRRTGLRAFQDQADAEAATVASAIADHVEVTTLENRRSNEAPGTSTVCSGNNGSESVMGNICPEFELNGTDRASSCGRGFSPHAAHRRASGLKPLPQVSPDLRPRRFPAPPETAAARHRSRRWT